MARRRSASIQARHLPHCALGKPWTKVGYKPKAGEQPCNCKKLNGRGPRYYIVSRPAGAVTKTGRPAMVREEVGHDLEDARRRLLAVLGSIDDGTHQAPRNLTFAEWGDEWFESLRRPNANTKRTYRSMLRYANEAFGAKLVRHITTGDVTKMLDLEPDNSPTTQRRHLRELRACLEAARRQRPPLCAINVVDELGDSAKPQARQRKASPFEQAELARLWKHLVDPYLTICKLSAATGMRQGELLALRWGAVDFDKRVIYVRSVYVQGIGFEDRAKSRESEREVILTEKAVTLLKEWRGRREMLPTSTALVFPGAGRDGQVVNSTLRRVLYDAMVKAGVPREWRPGHKMRDFHSFRHAYVSTAIGRGIGLEWVAEQLGHSSVSVTERHYKHFLTEARHDLGAVLDDALLL